ACSAFITDLADRSQTAKNQPPMVPRTGPGPVGLRREKLNQLGQRNDGPPFGQHPVGAQFSFEENRLVLAVAADAEFAATVRAAAMKDIELFGVEIDAMNPVF